MLKRLRRLCIVACGTSWHAALVGKFMIEDLCRIPVEVDLGSEFRYRNPLIDEKTLLLLISQSGETADTLAALREGLKKKARIISICNVVGSSMTRGFTWGHLYPCGTRDWGCFNQGLHDPIGVLYLLALLPRKTQQALVQLKR